MAVTNGPSKEYLEQMKAIGKQAEAAAAQAAAAQMQGSQAQRAQAAMAASMAQRTTGANKTQQAAAAAAPYSYKPGDPMAGVSAGTRAQLDKYQAGYSPSAAVNQAQNALAGIQGQKPGAYTPSAAVTQAQNALAGIQGQKPGAYNPSAAVIQAQNMLAQIQNNKPQGYNSKYAPQLEQILAEIQNPQDFKWDFNGDELFKTYADNYSRKGQQAMMNAIGNASALTGGYGNSYATQVGQQTYDEYMNDLFNVGMDLRDRAYQVYRDKQGDLLNRYNVLQNADQTDYGRYRDTVGDWQNELGYWTNQANAERNFDYGQHRDQVADWQTMLDYYTGRADTERNFDYGQHRDTVGDWQNELGYWTNQANAERNFDYGQHRDQVADWQTMLDYYTGRADTERNFDYGRHRDQVADWQTMLDYYTGRSDTERNFDYGTYADMLNYWANMAGMENQDYWNFTNLEWDKLSTEQKLAMDNAATMMQMGIAPSVETLMKAGYSAADAQAIIAMLSGAMDGGSGGGGGYGGGSGGGTKGNSGGDSGSERDAPQLGVMEGGAQLVNGMTDFAKNLFNGLTKKDKKDPWYIGR